MYSACPKRQKLFECQKEGCKKLFYNNKSFLNLLLCIAHCSHVLGTRGYGKAQPGLGGYLPSSSLLVISNLRTRWGVTQNQKVEGWAPLVGSR